MEATGILTAVVKNLGDASTGTGFSVKYFEDRNSNGTFEPAVDLSLADDQAPNPLGPGEEVTLSTPITAQIAFAGNLIYAIVDDDNSVAETDETNNTSNSGVSCQFAPVPGTFDPVLEWSWTSSSAQPSALNVMMTPGVMDLDDDGIPEVIFASTASTSGGLVEVGYLRALRGSDGVELFTITDSQYLINTAASVAVGNIDAEPRPEILACHSSGNRLIAFEH